MGALVADALSLGSHYEYDAKVIKNAYGGIISRYMAPGEGMGGTTHGIGWGRNNYHQGQKAGDQTDCGLYNLLVLEHLATRSNKKAPIDLKEFIPVWQRTLTSPSWGAWRDSMTKQTLQQLSQGMSPDQVGGMGNYMSMRHVAAHAVFEKEADVVKAARTVMFTHRNPEALNSGEFFARVVHRIIHKGAEPREALLAVAKKMGNWWVQKVQTGIDKFEEATDPNRPLSKEEFVDDLAATSMSRLWDIGKSEPIKIGKASPVEGTLPTTVYLILKYLNSFEDGAKANAMIGGCNADRSIPVGAVLGAHLGVESIPEDLKTTLNSWKKAEKQLSSLPLLMDRSDL